MSGLTPGFTSPHEAQACFRAVLSAFSRPGLVQKIAAFSAPAPLSPAAAAILLTLTDASTVLALPDRNEAVEDWLRFHTGTRFGALAEADFVMGSAANIPSARA
jgi:alpha-D-ribose 1-methylphosphonate 5-triphosphate synthase subunit PhnH